jgi:predicted alpha/beta hydrolase family esterase
MKRVYLIHGWDGHPDEHWFPWLNSELEAKGFEVISPAMPDTENPKKLEWTKTLKDLEPNASQDVYFVGHSLGCQAIQRYLETLEDGKVIGGAVFVAGWINDPMWEGRTLEETKVVHDWFDVPKDYEKIKSHCKKFVSIFSTNDEFILKSNWDEAKNILDAKVVILEN